MTQSTAVRESRISRLAFAYVTVAAGLVADSSVAACNEIVAESAPLTPKFAHVASASTHFKQGRLATAVRDLRYIPYYDAVSTDATGMVKVVDGESPEELLESLGNLKTRLEIARGLILSDDVPEEALHDHPFNTIVEVMDSCLKQMVAIRNDGTLNDTDEALFFAFAEALSVAKQNKRLIAQAIRTPKVYQSAIDKEGLVMLAKVGYEASSRFNA